MPGQLRVWLTVHDVGVNVAAITGVTPVPVKDTGAPVTVTLAVMVAVPVAAPVAVGANATVMVQLVPAARVAPQVPPVLENGAAPTPIVIPVAPRVPVLLNVRFSVLVCPVATLPNASGLGETLSTAAGVATNSTAPASTALFVFRFLPKKSCEGAAK